MKALFVAIQAAFLLIVSLLSSGAWAQRMDRARTWDFTLQMREVEGRSYNFDGGSSATTRNSLGFGFGFAYNLDNHLSVGGDIGWNNINYTANVNPAVGNPNSRYSGDGSLDTSSLMFNVTYNFLAGPVTPFVTGGIGAVYVDSNIPSGPAQPVCWYYPWYGYYCGTAVPTKSDTYFSYNYGLGLRWDLNRQVFLSGVVAEQKINVGGSAGYPAFLAYSLNLGFRF